MEALAIWFVRWRVGFSESAVYLLFRYQPEPIHIPSGTSMIIAAMLSQIPAMASCMIHMNSAVEHGRLERCRLIITAIDPVPEKLDVSANRMKTSLPVDDTFAIDRSTATSSRLFSLMNSTVRDSGMMISESSYSVGPLSDIPICQFKKTISLPSRRRVKVGVR